MKLPSILKLLSEGRNQSWTCLCFQVHLFTDDTPFYLHVPLFTFTLSGSRKEIQCVSGTFGGDANPVEVSGELFGDVGLPSGWETDHYDHSWGVGELGH